MSTTSLICVASSFKSPSAISLILLFSLVRLPNTVEFNYDFLVHPNTLQNFVEYHLQENRKSSCGISYANSFIGEMTPLMEINLEAYRRSG